MFPHYRPDKDNTPAFNVLLMHVGGRDGKTGKYSGIHSHLTPGRTIRYEYLDARRTRIGKITVLEDGKIKAIYQRPRADAGDPPQGEEQMDCIDCHNRPAHRFDGTAQMAVARALFEGQLDATQPYLAKVATAVLAQAGVPREQAEAHFQRALPAAYASLDARPSAEAMAQAVRAVAAIYLRNSFPRMKVTWNTYPDLLGHFSEGSDEMTGCLRCHDGQHETRQADGGKKALSKSCDLCHESLATQKAPDKLDDTLKQVVGIPLD